MNLLQNFELKGTQICFTWLTTSSYHYKFRNPTR